MRRERKRQETERRFLARQKYLHERRQRKQSSPVACQPVGDEDPAASDDPRATLGGRCETRSSLLESKAAEAAGAFSGTMRQR
jgi:hypothetical protein